MSGYALSLVNDLLAVAGIPGTSTLSTAIENVVTERQNTAVDILIGEISKGDIPNWEEGDKKIPKLAEMILRFQKAVNDGTGKQNLKLLARILAGLEDTNNFEADGFRRWCNALQDVSKNELLFISEAITVYCSGNSNPEAADFWHPLKEKMGNHGFGESEVCSLAASISKTGLIYPTSGYGGGPLFGPSPWLKDLSLLADLSYFTD